MAKTNFSYTKEQIESILEKFENEEILTGIQDDNITEEQEEPVVESIPIKAASPDDVNNNDL